METQELSAAPDDASALEETVRALQRPLEALLFVASEPLAIKRLAKLLGCTEVEVAATLQRIEADFSDRGIVVREVAGGYRFATAPVARDVVEAYLLPPKSNLSVPALEALAIVAYLQPVTKAEIEAIRGVASDSVVATLIDKSFVAEAGRKDVVGRPMLYKTTADFLEAFGLRSLDELPQMELEPGQPLELDLLTANLANAREAAQQSAEEQPEQPAHEPSAEPQLAKEQPAEEQTVPQEATSEEVSV